MKLTPTQVERFYSIWMPLVAFTNSRLKLKPGSRFPLDGSGSWNPHDVLPVRDALWADDSHLKSFLAANPAGLPANDLAVAASWRYRRAGSYYLVRHLKKYTLFVSEKPSEVFAVLGLVGSFDEIVPFVPCYSNTALLPFEGQITFDSILATHNVTFGSGIRKHLEQTCKDAKERGAIITSLEPAAPPGRAESRAQAESTNAKVLDAFRAHLFRAGWSEKVVRRDEATAATFAEYLTTLPGSPSLREFTSRHVKAYLGLGPKSTSLGKGPTRETVTGFKRFVRFLQETDRLPYDVAVYLLDVLRGKEG